MGKCKLYGMAGARVGNAVKTLEHAQKLIPANWFVTKIEGMENMQQLSNSNVSNGMLAVKFENGITMLVDSRGNSKGDGNVYIRTFRQNIQLTTVQLASELASNFTKRSFVAFPNKNKLLYIPAGSNGISSGTDTLSSYLISCDANGDITYESIEFPKPSTGKNFIIAGYANNDDTFYVLNVQGTTLSLQTYTFNSTDKTFILSGTLSLSNPGNRPAGTVHSRYIKECGLIFIYLADGSTYSDGIIDVNVGDFVVPLNYATSDDVHKLVNKFAKPPYQVFLSDFVINEEENAFCYLSATNKLSKLNLNSFTISTVTFTNSSITSWGMPVGLCKSKTPNVMHSAVLGMSSSSLEIFDYDLTNNTITKEQFSLKYGRPSELYAIVDLFHIDMFVFTQEYSTTTGSYIRLIPINDAHIVPYNGQGLYGLAATKAKAGDLCKVYTPIELATATMSMYGLSETSVNTIKDNAITEVQNELNK